MYTTACMSVRVNKKGMHVTRGHGSEEIPSSRCGEPAFQATQQQRGWPGVVSVPSAQRSSWTPPLHSRKPVRSLDTWHVCGPEENVTPALYSQGKLVQC